MSRARRGSDDTLCLTPHEQSVLAALRASDELAARDGGEQARKVSRFCGFAATTAASLDGDAERATLSLHASRSYGADGHAWICLRDTAGWSATLGWGLSRYGHSPYYFFPDLAGSESGQHAQTKIDSEVDATGILRLIRYLVITLERQYRRTGFNCAAFAAGAFAAATGIRAPGWRSLIQPIWTPGTLYQDIVADNTRRGVTPPPPRSQPAPEGWPRRKVTLTDGPETTLRADRGFPPLDELTHHVLDTAAAREAREYLPGGSRETRSPEARRGAAAGGTAGLIRDVYRRASLGTVLLPDTLEGLAVLGRPARTAHHDIRPGDYVIYRDGDTGRQCGGICTGTDTEPIISVDPTGNVRERWLPPDMAGAFHGRLSELAGHPRPPIRS